MAERDAEKIVRLAQEEADRLRSTIMEETEKIRKRRSLWFRKLVENCVVYGDRG